MASSAMPLGLLDCDQASPAVHSAGFHSCLSGFHSCLAVNRSSTGSGGSCSAHDSESETASPKPKEDVFVLKRCHGTTPAQTYLKFRTAGKPPPTQSWSGEPGSHTSATLATTSWEVTPSPANGTSVGAATPRFVRKVSQLLCL